MMMIMLHKEDTLVDRPGRGDQTLNKWNVVTMESSITRALIKMDMTIIIVIMSSRAVMILMKGFLFVFMIPTLDMTIVIMMIDMTTVYW